MDRSSEHCEQNKTVRKYIALAFGGHLLCPPYPPIKVYKFSGSAFSAGIEEHRIDALTVKIYNPEKTLADCFKFRNKIGMDVVLEALKLYRNNMKFRHKKILEYARICRVDKIILPYLEANI